MKKILMVAAMMLMSIGAFAQEAGKMAAGIDAGMAFKSGETRFGIGAKFQYAIVENFRAEAFFRYYPKKDYNTCWNAGLNLQYAIPVVEKFNVYPIVGAGIFGMKISDFGFGSESTTLFEFHGGAGAEYYLSDAMKIYAEFIYQYGKKDGVKVVDNPLVSLGVAFAF